MPNSTTYLNLTFIFKRYVVWCGSKIGYRRHTCLSEMDIRVHDTLTILGSIVLITGVGWGEAI